MVLQKIGELRSFEKYNIGLLYGTAPWRQVNVSDYNFAREVENPQKLKVNIFVPIRRGIFLMAGRAQAAPQVLRMSAPQA